MKRANCSKLHFSPGTQKVQLPFRHSVIEYPQQLSEGKAEKHTVHIVSEYMPNVSWQRKINKTKNKDKSLSSLKVCLLLYVFRTRKGPIVIFVRNQGLMPPSPVATCRTHFPQNLYEKTFSLFLLITQTSGLKHKHSPKIKS